MVEFLDPVSKENWEALNKDVQKAVKKNWIDPLQKIIDDCPDFSEHRETFVSVKNGETTFNPIARKIGKQIHQYVKDTWDNGGLDREDFEETSIAFMRLVFYSLKFGPSDGRVLDFCWNGIGFWRS